MNATADSRNKPAEPAASIPSTLSTHTPGPWKLQPLEDEHNGYADWRTYAIRSPANVCLAVVGHVDRYESERIPANARLIAAAPELLAAGQAVLDNWEHGDLAAAVRNLAEAIASARGEG